MKKVFSIALSILMIFALCFVAFAAGTPDKLSFNEDGTFKILQINDTQDIDRMNKKTAAHRQRSRSLSYSLSSKPSPGTALR